MKRTFGILAMLVGLLAVNAAEAYDYDDSNTGVYVNGFGGLNWACLSGAPVSAKTGFVVAGAGGYKFDTGTSLEGEVAYRNNDIKGAPVDLSSTAIMVNAYQDIGIDALPFTPYVGAGLGHAWNKAAGVSVSDGFAWQAMAGAHFEVADQTELGLEYRVFQPAKKIYDHSVGVTARRYF